MIKYKLTVNLTEKGKRLLNKETFSCCFDSKTSLSNEELLQMLLDEYLCSDLMDSKSLDIGVYDDFSDVKFDDLLKIHVYLNDSSSEERMCFVTEIDSQNTKFKVTGCNYWFDFSGKCITRKKSNIPYLIRLTHLEFESYLEEKEKQNKICDIERLLGIDYYSHNGITASLTKKQVNDILTILTDEDDYELYIFKI